MFTIRKLMSNYYKYVFQILPIYFSLCSCFSQALSLKDALQSTLQNNPILKTESFNTSIANTDIITAGIRPNFKLNNQTLMLVDAPYFAPSVPWVSNKNRQDWWQLTKVIQWPGQRKWKIATSIKQSEIIKNNFTETERSVMLTVAEKYLEVWSGMKQVLILKEAKENLDSLARVNKNKFLKGLVSETDYLRTEILSEECDIQISETNLDLQNNIRSLQLLMGTTDSITIDTSMKIVELSFNLDSLLKDALSQRPDILSSKSKIDYSLTNIKLQKRLAFPKLDFGLIWNPQNTVQYIGFIATVDIPVFDRNQGEVKKSFLMKDQYEQNFLAIKAQVNTEVINSYDEFNNKKSNILKYRTIFSKTALILDDIRLAYSKGETDIIDFLEAQRSWIESKNYYIDLLYKYYKSYVNLLYDAGKINKLIME